MSDPDHRDGTIGIGGALSIGIGGMVGGGFFATFGLAVVGARGATWIAFLLGGLIALVTAYSYVRLTLRYPGPGGTVSFVRHGFGIGLLPASINVLLILSYVAIMAIYARALAAYTVVYLPAAERDLWTYVIASAAIVVIGLVNFAGTRLMQRSEAVFNTLKLFVLAVFILAGFALGTPDWSRLGPTEWVPWMTIVASGMTVFLAYEGFELIANASDRIRDPRRTLPIAFYGSVVATVAIYVLAVLVAIGHLPFAAMSAARDFALSAAAAAFMGKFGFTLLTLGAITASASAVNADFFGAEQLPPTLARDDEMRPVFARTRKGKPVASMLLIGVVALLAVNLLDLAALSAATSGGFLIVYAAVNVANAKLAVETGSRRWISVLAAVLCIAALALMLVQFAADPATRGSAWAVLGVVVLAVVHEGVFRLERERLARVAAAMAAVKD